MPDLVVSPFTGNIFNRRTPARLTAAAPPPRRGVNPLLSRILRPGMVGNWMLPSVSSLTPQTIETILRGALGGNHVQQWELFDLMTDTWPRLQKNTDELIQGVIALDWKLEAWADEDTPPSDMAKERRKVVSAGVWEMQPPPDEDLNGFEQMLADICSAWLVGLSVQEIIWEHRRVGSLGEFVLPASSAWVHPSNYAWSAEGFLGLNPGREINTGVFRERARDIERFPENKFLIALAKSKSGPAQTAARLRALAWWWLAQNFAEDWLMNLAQLFGIPFRWATYSDNAEDDTVTEINDLLLNMGSNGYAAFPEGTDLNFLEAGKNAGTSPQDGLIDRADKACDLLLHWETTTSEVREQGGAFASAKVGLTKQAKAILACANFGARVFNQQLIPAILLENYGEREEAPYFCPEFETQKDLTATATLIKSAVDTGLQVPKKWAHSELNIPLPQAGEEIIERAPVAPNPYDPNNPSRPGGTPPQPDQTPPADAEDVADLEARAALRAAAALTPEERVALALADKSDPVLRLLNRIADIEDPELFTTTLRGFYMQMPAITALITADVTRQQRALEAVTAAALQKGLEGK